MIVCGWCGAGTEPDSCSTCGRDPVLPWVQRAIEPPEPSQEHEPGGRPVLDASQIAQRLRIGRKELGAGVTNAALADHLGVSERTLSRWQKLAG